ncbi:MAG: hypothetical protein PHH07_01125 [Candidatus Cloacimonetes bacterium]|jgi:uncharacterized protein YceK|nr:hypothetical protein [Candidatus Cloacimonadota bacterium]
MKKLILPLLLLVAFGMLAAVESNPSDVVGYVKYDLIAGNNTLALPMVQTYAMAGDVGNAITGCGTVRYFDASTQLWVAATKNFLGNWVGNFAVTNGQPLQIVTTATQSFYSIGDLPSTLPTYTLIAGNNMIMVPLDESALNMAGLVGNSISGCGTVRYFDASTQLWVSATKNFLGNWVGNFATAIGDPLQIVTTTAQTWPTAKLSK